MLVTVNNRLKFEIEIVHDLSCLPIQIIRDVSRDNLVFLPLGPALSWEIWEIFEVTWIQTLDLTLDTEQIHVGCVLHSLSALVHSCCCPVWGRGTPLPLLSIYFLIFSPFYFSLSFIGFTYFLLLSIPSLSTRIVPLRFQARGRRRRPNLGLVCVLFCNLCCLYSLVKMDCGVLFYLV